MSIKSYNKSTNGNHFSDLNDSLLMFQQEFERKKIYKKIQKNYKKKYKKNAKIPHENTKKIQFVVKRNVSNVIWELNLFQNGCIFDFSILFKQKYLSNNLRK